MLYIYSYDFLQLIEADAPKGRSRISTLRRSVCWLRREYAGPVLS
ncbi:hypothetical protein KNP414_04154 [Paenibacillus mucilaginosus KNP414]|uniref:Uncharacterized protein n=1 Tax=Paenibacillus mucilaginosus (strain KNP414) TaxID=1036673 RepID=F8FFQ9_PAEMK|nr:hypothetical protein KNP414_04154 [Paenibacillus mucilaginosus KNP414]